MQAPTEQLLEKEACVADDDPLRSDAAAFQDESKSETSISTGHAEAAQTNLPPRKKVKYCKRCGSLIDPDTKKCCGCGKQYFRQKMGVPIIVLTIICIISVSFNVAQFIWERSQASALAESKNQIEILQKDISSREKTIHDQGLWLASQNLKVFFYEDYACCVNKGSEKYHLYGCEDFDASSSFWIYNIDAAKSLGYYACSKCY